MMKRLIQFLTLLLFCTSLSAVDFRVTSFHQDALAHVADLGEQVFDENGDTCAVLRVETDLKEEIYINYPKFYKKVKKVGIYYFYIPHRKRLIRFSARGYMPVEYKTPIAMKKGMTYVIKIKADDENLRTIPVVIQSKPADAEKFINGKSIGTSEIFRLRKGTYELKLKKKGYKTITKTIRVSANNFLFKDLYLEEENK